MRITFEDGQVVLRDSNGQLVWSKHSIDLREDMPAVNFVGIIDEDLPDGKFKITPISS